MTAMGKLKVALSVLALLVMAAAGVTTFGSWSVPPGVSELLAAGASLLAYLGYQPFAVPTRVSAVCATLSMMATGFVGSHAAAWGDGHRHVAIILVAFAGALFGVLARGPQTETSAARQAARRAEAGGTPPAPNA
jgi:hypothetical protein